MKNRKLSIIFIVILIVSFLGCSKQDLHEDNTAPSATLSNSTDTLEIELIAYSYAVSTFCEVTVDEIEEKVKMKEDFFLYVGRETCEWCRKVAPVLSQITQERSITVYYLDSTNTESDEQIKNFRNDYCISHVPEILKFSSNGTYEFLEYDLSQSRKDLAVTLSELLH